MTLLKNSFIQIHIVEYIYIYSNSKSLKAYTEFHKCKLSSFKIYIYKNTDVAIRCIMNPHS